MKQRPLSADNLPLETIFAPTRNQLLGPMATAAYRAAFTRKRKYDVLTRAEWRRRYGI